MNRLSLSSGWQLKARDGGLPLHEDFSSGDGWIPACVPGTVHQALMAAEHIPNPFFGLNELAVQWVGEQDWLYRCRFDLPRDFANSGTLELCFEGLDCFATVWLNGQAILTSDNMFVPHRVPVGPLLRAEGNTLWLGFESVLRWGREQEAAHGVAPVWNGDPSRVYVRKAQYHYGWDWGPTLLTAGPCGAIRLETFHARIVDIHCPVEIAPDLDRAALPVTVMVEGEIATLALRLTLYDPEGEGVECVTVPVGEGRATHTFRLAHPRLWWPRGYGMQSLYRLEATLVGGEEVLDLQVQRLGLRRLRLLQEPLAAEPGTSFVFEVNNVPLFCGGANWIPADSFPPRVTDDHYRALLQLAADANMLMVRVWGGGIYEPDIFYDTCDELGLLVWQDFMFACGLYPAHPAFQASVRAEAEAAVRRLRNHPALVLWCGNNEDYSLAHSLGLYDPTETDDLARSAFPARQIYERLLPEVCAALDPATPYWSGSPYAGVDPNDGTGGDRHTWDVWHGAMAPYQSYPAFAGRFVSEFGMQALPALATIEAFAEPAERYAASRTLEHHNKAEGGTRRLAVYLADTLRAPTDLASAVYATQLVQAEALGAAWRGWRRRFGPPGYQAVAGALVWQLNDCWPVTSWAIVDHALRPKAAYFVARRELAPLVVGLAHAAGGAAVWAVNGTLAPVEVEIRVATWTLDGVVVPSESRWVTLAPNQATELGHFPFAQAASLVCSAQLLVEGSVVSRAVLWPEPYKYLTLPDPALHLAQRGESVWLRVARPAKGVWLDAGDGITWSDNLLDLMPGDEQVVTARGLGERVVRARWLGCEG